VARFSSNYREYLQTHFNGKIKQHRMGACEMITRTLQKIA